LSPYPTQTEINANKLIDQQCVNSRYLYFG